MKMTTMAKFGVGAIAGFIIGKAIFGIEKECTKTKLKNKMIKILD